MNMIRYLDPRTKATYPLDPPRWCGDDRQPLLLTPVPGIEARQVDKLERSLWRYRAAMPFQVDEPISMGEGCTPLLERSLHGGKAYLKCEWFMPTGSFKDRGASVMLSLLRAQGVRDVLEDSSGNGGAAIAAYAAAGGMAATIMTPESTSPAKTLQARAYGATVELIPGTRQQTAEAAAARAATTFYASHSWHPFFLHGTKTLAYELWEDLGFAAPDHVIIPCGGGSNVLGCWIGFRELQRAGAIYRMPRLWAAQPEHCGPIAAATLGIETPPVQPTIAEGTAIAEPIRLLEVVRVLQGSQGGAVLLSETEIEIETMLLARHGIYVEPTCAQASAAYAKLLAAGQIGAEEVTVLVLTGTGLKATPRFAEMLGVVG